MLDLHYKLADKTGRVPTEKQLGARNRNWRLRQLRAYFHLVPPGTSEKAKKRIQAIIDGEIRSLGAESEIKRESKRIEEL